MKRLKGCIITTFILLTALSATSQKNSGIDSCTCVPNAQLVAALKDHEAHKVCKLERDQLQGLFELCKERLAGKDEIIGSYKKLLQAYQADSLKLEREKQNLQQQIAIRDINIAALNKQLRKQKAQAGIFKGLTGGALAALAFVIIKK